LFWLVSVGAACSKSPPPEEGVVSEKPEYGDELVEGVFHQPGLLNPLVTDSTVAANLFDLISDSLVTTDQEEEIIPSLTERWEISDDGRVWTFYLKKGVLFHDGAELTAEDVKFTLEQIAKRRWHGFQTFFKCVKKFSAPERYLFRMELSRYDHALWGGLLLNIVPRHLFIGKSLPPFDRKPVGTGPFRFVSRNDEEIVLEANENHFRGRPYLDRLRLKVVRSPQVYIDLAVGKIDLLGGIDEEYYAFLSQLPDIRVYRKRASPFLYMLCFNTRREMFRSPEIRRAVEGVIDRQKLTALPLQEKWQAASGPFPSWEDDRYLPLPDNDPEEARKILSRQKSPLRFVITADESELNRKIVGEIQKEFAAAGIRTSTRFLPLREMIEVLKKKDFDLALLRSVYDSRLFSSYPLWHSGEIASGINFSSYSNPAADRALDRIRFSPDEAERREAFREFQKVLREDPPAVFLFWRYLPFAIHKRFRGVLESGSGGYKMYREIWVPKEEQKPLLLGPSP
jgi:peptide/nickel transport system substrate-binding protein